MYYLIRLDPNHTQVFEDSYMYMKKKMKHGHCLDKIIPIFFISEIRWPQAFLYSESMQFIRISGIMKQVMNLVKYHKYF